MPSTKALLTSITPTLAAVYFKILTTTTLILSALTVALLIVRHAQFGYYTWNAQEASKTLGTFMFVSLVFSVVNVLVNFPIFLDMIVDIVLSAGIISWVFRLIDAFPNSNWCRYPPGNPSPKCKD